MRARKLAAWARLAQGLPAFLAEPVTLEGALAGIAWRLGRREEHFLELARTAVYANPGSPLRRLLLWAGCELGDLQARVRSRGLEATLEELRAQGVFLGFAELKGQAPLCRAGLTLEVAEEDFDNPLRGGQGVAGRTSGTRSAGSHVTYDWPFIAEEAENERVLYEQHAVCDAPTALWYPLRAGLAGIHNLLMNLKYRRPPERWFSQTRGGSPRERLMAGYLRWCASRMRMHVPPVQSVELGRAGVVAAWMGAAKRRGGRAVLRSYASSAVRAVQAALEAGIEISGCTVFTGGEPLSLPRQRFLESAGVRSAPRYVATETGLLGAACGRGASHDEMHVYLDRVALIPSVPGGLLATTLLSTTPKVLINAELGDSGSLQRRPCECLFGSMGMDLHVSGVGSLAKFSAAGMTVPVEDLDAIVAGLVGALGGSPEDYQFWRLYTPSGDERLAVVVDPSIPGVDEPRFVGSVLDRLAGEPRGRLAADLWRQAGTLQLVRERPRTTSGYKGQRYIEAPPRTGS